MKALVLKALGFFLGNGLQYISSFAVFALLLRVADKGDYGHFVYTQTVVLWISALVQFGMSITGASLVSRDPERSSATAVTIVLLRLGLAAIVGSGLAVAGAAAPDALQRQLLWAYIPYMFAVAVQLEFLAIGRGQAGVLARAQGAAAAVYLGAVLLFLRPGTPLWVVPLFLALGQACGALVQYRALLPRGAWRSGLPGAGGRALSLVRAGGPTTFAQFVQLGYYSVDIVLLEAWRRQDIGGVGEYGATSRLMQIGVMPLVALVNVLGPRLSAAAAAGDAAEVARQRHLFLRASAAIGVVGAVLFAVLAPWFLETIGGQPMPVTREVAPIFGLAYLLIGLHSPFSASLPFLDRRGSYAWCNLAALLTALSACAVLVPRFGFVGAAWGLVSGLVALGIGSVAAHRLRPRGGSGGARALR